MHFIWSRIEGRNESRGNSRKYKSREIEAQKINKVQVIKDYCFVITSLGLPGRFEQQ